MEKHSRTCLTIILAAGEGTRMRSPLPKVLHEVAGLPMLGHVVRTAEDAGGDAHAVIIGTQAELVRQETAKFSSNIEIREQTERLGTAHAVLAAKDVVAKGFDDVLILFGDTPLIKTETLTRMRLALAEGADLAVLGFFCNDPTGYGRLLEQDGELVAIREHKEASSEELKVNFCNAGLMAFSGSKALEIIEAVGNDNSKGEYYLTDGVEIARAQGLKVVALEGEEEETIGVNNRVELAKVEAIWQQRRREQLMLDGVSMQAPETIFLHHDTVIQPGVKLEPNIVFGKQVQISSGATILAFSHIDGASVGEGAVVGPFARLRPGSNLSADSKVGNFCEVKKADIGKGAKVNHLTYIGDATVGENANIGAGTITCNYDGVNKHLTTIGANAFIGSNSSLVAPVTIADGAYVASGSVITTNIPADNLGLARAKQVNKDGYAKKIRERNAAIKAAKSKSG